MSLLIIPNISEITTASEPNNRYIKKEVHVVYMHFPFIILLSLKDYIRIALFAPFRHKDHPLLFSQALSG